MQLDGQLIVHMIGQRSQSQPAYTHNLNVMCVAGFVAGQLVPNGIDCIRRQSLVARVQ